MNLELFKQELMRDEGYVTEIYLCPTGHATLGCGHMIKRDDPEYGLRIGAKVTDERCQMYLDWDAKTAINDCQEIYSNFHQLPSRVQHVLANMAFNMGRIRLSKFLRMNGHIENGAFDLAADEMVDSRWYHQTGQRSIRLVDEMRSAAQD